MHTSGKQLGLWGLIRSDIRRKQEHYVLVNRFFNRYVKVGLQHGTLAVVAYRIGHWAHTRPSPVWRTICSILFHLAAWPASWLGRVYINPRVPIGEGFVIHNFSTIFVDAERIGSNFTINQGVSVGYDYKRQGLPTLGDNVFLGSGAAVLGHVNVGDNVVIAANCLVEKSIEPRAVVVGVPGSIVQRNVNADYVGNVPAQQREVPPPSA